MAKLFENPLNIHRRECAIPNIVPKGSPEESDLIKGDLASLRQKVNKTVREEARRRIRTLGGRLCSQDGILEVVAQRGEKEKLG
jgi:hypothetical protein